MNGTTDSATQAFLQPLAQVDTQSLHKRSLSAGPVVNSTSTLIGDEHTHEGRPICKKSVATQEDGDSWLSLLVEELAMGEEDERPRESPTGADQPQFEEDTEKKGNSSSTLWHESPKSMQKSNLTKSTSFPCLPSLISSKNPPLTAYHKVFNESRSLENLNLSEFLLKKNSIASVLYDQENSKFCQTDIFSADFASIFSAAGDFGGAQNPYNQPTEPDNLKSIGTSTTDDLMSLAPINVDATFSHDLLNDHTLASFPFDSVQTIRYTPTVEFESSSARPIERFQKAVNIVSENGFIRRKRSNMPYMLSLFPAGVHSAPQSPVKKTPAVPRRGNPYKRARKSVTTSTSDIHIPPLIQPNPQQMPLIRPNNGLPLHMPFPWLNLMPMNTQHLQPIAPALPTPGFGLEPNSRRRAANLLPIPPLRRKEYSTKRSI